MENEFKIKLLNAKNISERVIFDVTPDLSETRNINYKTLDPVHMPGQIMIFNNTSSRTFNVTNIKLISRNNSEADKNLKILWLLRSWCMPRFGLDSSSQNEQNRNANGQENDSKPETIRRRDTPPDDRSKVNDTESTTPGTPGSRGEPPQVLYLSAYSTDNTNKPQHINKVPVVITNLSIPYPTDTDYIPSNDGTPMPTIMTLDLNLVETHAPVEYEKFSLDNFKMGILKNF